MSHEVFGCSGQDSVDHALELMRRHRVRRLPVLDPDRHVIGLLSINDVVRALEHHADRGEQKSLMERLLSTLDTICEHREVATGELVPRAKAQPPSSKGKPSRARK